MKQVKAYLTVRYYADKNGTRYKIVSSNNSKWFEAYEYYYVNDHLEWRIVCTDSNFKSVYDFVQELLDYV